MNATPLPALLTAEELAGVLGLGSVWCVYRLVNKGCPRVFLGDRNYKFDPIRVRAWLEAGGAKTGRRKKRNAPNP